MPLSVVSGVDRRCVVIKKNSHMVAYLWLKNWIILLGVTFHNHTLLLCKLFGYKGNGHYVVHCSHFSPSNRWYKIKSLHCDSLCHFNISISWAITLNITDILGYQWYMLWLRLPEDSCSESWVSAHWTGSISQACIVGWFLCATQTHTSLKMESSVLEHSVWSFTT